MYSCVYCDKSLKANVKQHQNACHLNPSNIAHCECCGKLITRNSKRRPADMRKFCGNSCAAKVSNSNREVTWADKTRKTINEFYDKDPRYRNYERINKMNSYRKLVERYCVRQMKDLKPEMYEYWQSNPYTGSGDTSRLSVEHIKPIIECFEEGWTVEQAGDISNLEIIPYRENNLRYKKRKKKLDF